MTIITLGFISFINLFLVPIVGLKIYYKRHEIEWRITTEMGHLYVVFVVLNFLLTHIFLEIVEMATSMVIHLEMSKYTMVALVSCVLLAFLVEGVEKYLYVKVAVSVRESKGKKKEDSVNEE